MNKLKMILPLAVAVMFAVNASAQTMDDLNNKYNEAGQAMQERKFPEAIKGFEEVIAMGEKVGPESIETIQKARTYLVSSYYMLGGSQASAKNYDAAVEAFTKSEQLAALINDPAGKTRASQMISRVYMAQGAEVYNAENYAKAVEVFSKGYKAAPNNTQLALYLAESYDKLDSLDQAISVYRGIMGLTHSNYAEAVAKAKTDLTTTLLYRAVEASKANKLDDVVALTGHILEYDQQNDQATLLRVQTANNMKRYASVVEYAQAAIDAQTDPAKKSEAYYLLGVAQQNRENTAAAVAALKNVTAGPFAAEAKKLAAELNK